MTRLITRMTLVLGRLASRIGHWRSALQVVAVLLAFGLGFWGWTIQTPPQGAQDWLNNLFKTFQLITLHFPRTFDGAVPWQLQVGRLAVPMAALFASLNLIATSLSRPARLALLQHSRDHIIFFGAPKLTDEALAWLAQHGHQMVVIQPGVCESRIQALEGIGLTVLDIEPRRAEVLDRLSLPAARGVFIATNDDINNANLAVMVIERAKPRDAALDPLLLAVEFGREDLAAALVRTVDGLAREHRVRFHRLSPDREALSIELERGAAFLWAHWRVEPAHALVLGLTGDWERVLSRLVVALQVSPDRAPLITMCLDPIETERFEDWRRARPNLVLVARVVVLPRAAHAPPSGDDMRAAWGADVPMPQLLVVMQDDADALVSVLALRRRDSDLGTTQGLTLVHQSREDHLFSALADLRHGVRDFSHVHPFGGLLREESVERLFDRRSERLAIQLHAHYRDAAEGLGVTASKALEAWENLPENLRDANRSAAAHAPILLRAIGRDPDRFTGAEHGAISAHEWDRLAQIEHRRWCADRIDHGWRHGETRDDENRLHPSLVPWDALSVNDQQKDRNAVQTLLELLAHGGPRAFAG